MYNRLLITLLLILTLCGCMTTNKQPTGAGASGISYPENPGPLSTDQLLGIDDPSGSWAINRFTLSDLPLSDAAVAESATKADQTSLDTTNTAVALNTAKTGITPDQANAIIANTAKVTGVVDASGFDGNLTTSDDTPQEIAQALDDLVSGSGTGDVTGPASSVANNIPVFGDTTGKTLIDSGATINVDGSMSTAAVSGGGGYTILDADAPGAAKKVSGYTGSYVDGAEGAENGILTFWAKLTGAVTNYFRIDTSTDSVVFYKNTTLPSGDIVNAEIADNTIEADKLEATNIPTNGYYPAFDSTTGGVTWSLVTGGTGYTTTPTYSDDPCTIGQYSWDASYYYGCESTNQWDRYPVTWASWSNPTPSIPTYSSGSVLAVGNSMNVVFSEACTTGTGWAENLFTVEGSVTGVGNMLLASGDTTDTWNFTTDVTYQTGETITLDFASVTDGVESSTGGDLASIVDGAVTNNSTQTALACTGAIQDGDTESFEKAEGEFCTTGWVETDTEGVISTYSTDQANCGTHSMHITQHSSVTSNVTGTIADNTTFTLRYYIRIEASVTPDYTTISYGSLLNSSSGAESVLAVRHDTGTDYRLYFNGVSTSYISVLADTWYYVTIEWDGTGTVDGTRMKVYNTSAVAQSATNGFDGTTLSATETDGINYIKFLSTSSPMSVYIDDVVYSSIGADLSGGQVCE